MRLHVLAALALASFGCVSTNASVLNPSVSYQKICPDGVMMFTSAERVQKEYYEVAILNSKGESSWTDEKGMTASQRSKAAKLGANGIILGDVKEPNAGTKIIGSIFGTGAERKGKGLAIFIPGDSNRVRRACNGKGGGSNVVADDEPQVPPAGMAARPPAPPPAQAPTRAAERGDPVVVNRPVVAQRVPRPATPPPPAPDTPSEYQAGGVEAAVDAPSGTRYVADTEKKVYMPVGCTTFIREMVPANRYYYQTEAAAQADGYRRSPDC